MMKPQLPISVFFKFLKLQFSEVIIGFLVNIEVQKITENVNIKKDEELTIDYGYDEIYEYCNCDKCIYRKAI